MKQYFKFFAQLIFSIIAVSTYAFENSEEGNAMIRINSKDHKNQQLQFQYPFSGTKIELNSAGDGMITLSVKDKVFTELSAEGINAVPIFLESGNDLVVTIKNNNFFFTGKGADPNNYLMKSVLLLKQFRDSIQVVMNENSSFEKIMSIYNLFESKFFMFHKRYSDSVSFSKEVDYLLKNDIYALILTEKQKFLSYFSKNEIDSLDLENKLELLKNNLYQDTLLINTRSINLKTFLFFHQEYEIKKTITAEEIEKGLYPVICNQIIRARYSQSIQEFLLFTELGISIQLFGRTSIIDSIAEKLKTTYPLSEYLPDLVSRYKEFEYLSPGSDAPDFKGMSPDGKLYALKDFKGKVALIDVWATWCKGCIESFPSVYALQEVFKNEAIVFLFISRDKEEDNDKWKKFLNQHPELEKGINLRINNEDFSKAYKITAIPRYILIDKEGRIVDAFLDHPNEKVKSTIANLLK
jgi:thiol-disulfide isomerase/thioredoxin